MPYVQCDKAGRWSVNFAKRDVEQGEIVQFNSYADAEFIVSKGLGSFVSDANAAVLQNKAVTPPFKVSKPVAAKKAPRKKAVEADEADA
jgi:hypothetical protein